jgi:hypothetical protein
MDYGDATPIMYDRTQRNGKTSLQIGELVVGRAHYTLRNTTGTVNTRAPGTGSAVEFDLGKVLEMRLASSSIHEKISDRH